MKRNFPCHEFIMDYKPYGFKSILKIFRLIFYKKLGKLGIERRSLRFSVSCKGAKTQRRMRKFGLQQLSDK
ncbi:hypothetical protein VF12_17925 [Nostoc linckia z15]|nr:hypothetical protein VF12_17925 [Nostoc linckia z15]